MMRTAIAFLGAVLMLPLSAKAEDRWYSVFTQASTPEAPRNFFNLRLGGTTAFARPELCGELAPHWRVAVEGCGSGREFLHRDPIPEVAHFRAKLTFTQLKTKVGWFEPRAAAGFAELQLGEDELGFDFVGVNRTATSTAGPEVGASLRWFVPLPVGIDFLVEIQASLAFFGSAPRLAAPQAVVQPSVSATAGLGF